VIHSTVINIYNRQERVTVIPKRVCRGTVQAMSSLC